MDNNQHNKLQYHTEDLSKFNFLVTGGAGFIGSNLVEYLLKFNAGKVRVLDNLSTGYIENVQEFMSFSNFEFIKGDICDIDTCRECVEGIDFVFHQAALGSVPRSILDPVKSNLVNVSGFLNMLFVAKESNIKRFIYAASSSTYGDSKELPKIEENIGMPLSPYAVTKYVNELYAHVFTLNYGIETIGLRYFNVFGPKQSPNGAYAAVIPKFINQLVNLESPTINGDGSNSRDFTYIENVIQANIVAAFSSNYKVGANNVYNVAFGERNTLNQLVDYLINSLGKYKDNIYKIKINYGENRQGDIPHSHASIEKAKLNLGYNPEFSLKIGIDRTVSWFMEKELSK